MYDILAETLTLRVSPHPVVKNTLNQYETQLKNNEEFEAHRKESLVCVIVLRD